MIPLVKDSHGSHSDVGNYRGISISSVISKIFEHILKAVFSTPLSTLVYQFSFKKDKYMSHALHCFRETVNYYIDKVVKSSVLSSMWVKALIGLSIPDSNSWKETFPKSSSMWSCHGMKILHVKSGGTMSTVISSPSQPVFVKEGCCLLTFTTSMLMNSLTYCRRRASVVTSAVSLPPLSFMRMTWQFFPHRSRVCKPFFICAMATVLNGTFFSTPKAINIYFG